jgi:hypothetical protein
MSKIIRHEFMGSWLLFWILCLTGFGLPFAILYLVNSTLTLETEVDDAELFVEEFRASRQLKGRQQPNSSSPAKATSE